MPVHTYSFPELRGRHGRLRAPCAGDAARLFALFSDAGTMRWWPRAPMETLGEAAGHVDECAAFFASGERIDWIVADPRDDAAIGTCTLYDIDPRARSAAVGYALLPAHRRRGIATDAVAQVIAWSRRALGITRFDASVARGNVASIRLLERLGFSFRCPVDAVEGTDGVERWTLDADEAAHSWRSADSRYALPSAYKARRAR